MKLLVTSNEKQRQVNDYKIEVHNGVIVCGQ